MDVYHAGLEGLIGLPSPDIETAIEWEHTKSWYATEVFQCWYIPGGTTAMSEYTYVHSTAIEANCRNGLRDRGHGGWILDDYMRNNSIVEMAGLQRAEVAVLRLYTGPMYLW